MRNLVSKSQRRLLGALFMVSNLAWLSACEQETQKPNVVGDGVSFELPSQVATVDNPQNLISAVYIKEVGSSAPAVKVPLQTTVRQSTSTVTAKGTTSAFQLGKDYQLQLEVTYDRSLDPQTPDIVRIFHSEDIPISIQRGLDGKTIEGTAQLTAADFAKHKLFPDDDSDGYSNLQELDSSLGGNKTDIHDAFDYPGKIAITSPYHFSFVSCPLLNTKAMSDLSPPGYSAGDYRGCSNDNSNNIWIFDSAPATYDIIMATDFNFNNISMGHPNTQITPFAATFPGWLTTRIYRHPGMANTNSMFWGLLDLNCARVQVSPEEWACDKVKWKQAGATNLNQPVQPMWFVSQFTRSYEQTKYLPTWIKLDSNVDTKNGSSDITISWEDLYADTNRDIVIRLLRSTSMEAVQIDNYSTDGSISTTTPQVPGKQLPLNSDELLKGKATDPGFNLQVDASGHGVLTYVDKDPLGGVVYFYAIEVTYTDGTGSHTVTTSPIGISTFAKTRYIEGVQNDPAHPTSGNIIVIEGTSGADVSLATPVAYGTTFTYYYIPNDNSTLLATDITTFKDNCVQQTAPTYSNCISGTNPPNYTFTVLSSQMSTDVLMEKVDRYGRYAGHEIARF